MAQAAAAAVSSTLHNLPFSSITLKPVVNGMLQGEPTTAGELITKPTVIFVVRRPGCVLCREEGQDLKTLKNEGKLGDVDLIGIIKEVAPVSGAQTDEELGVGEFQKKYFPFPLYLDEEWGTYQYLGSRSITSFFTCNLFKIYRAFKTMGKRTKEKNVEGNMKGEGLTLGGIIVYSPSKGIVYEYKEKTGDEIPRDEIAAAAQSLF